MAFTASVEIRKQFDVSCPFDHVFDLLANVPKSVSHFPNVEQLVDLGDNTFRWEMKKIGIDRFYVQTIYACKYVDDKKKGTIKWTPVKGEGNGIVKGDWVIKALDEKRTHIELCTDGTLEIPLPRLVKFVVAPVVAREFEKMVDTYIKNLYKKFIKMGIAAKEKSSGPKEDSDVKKSAAKKTPAKKAPVKKAAAKKPAAKKAPAKKAAAKKPAAKKAPVKKVAAKKPAAKKAPAKKAAAKKPAAKKAVVKKPVTKRAPAKKAVAKKPAAKKAVAKKPAAKKAVAKKPAAKKAPAKKK